MKNIQLIIIKKNNPKNNKNYLNLSFSNHSNIIEFKRKKNFFEHINLYIQKHFLLLVIIFIIIFIIFKYT